VGRDICAKLDDEIQLQRGKLAGASETVWPLFFLDFTNIMIVGGRAFYSTILRDVNIYNLETGKTCSAANYPGTILYGEGAYMANALENFPPTAKVLKNLIRR